MDGWIDGWMEHQCHHSCGKSRFFVLDSRQRHFVCVFHPRQAPVPWHSHIMRRNPEHGSAPLLGGIPILLHVLCVINMYVLYTPLPSPRFKSGMVTGATIIPTTKP
jgi:hypothetical protein